MLATQTPEPSPVVIDVTQLVKEKLVLSLKALQKRYVTSDAVVTSEDGDANLLCSALEAIFIHGIKGKHIHAVATGRKKKGARGSLPQPVFWSLLKSVTHRDVIAELEKLSFVSTDVGRCRAWLRLALNHGLLECYLVSLFREGSMLQAHYQPAALLLNPEEREVLISYLQGLASLTFNLSYKSAVLNEWTTTPLALGGLCPAAQADGLEPPTAVNGGTPSQPKELAWDTASQSSGSSDTVEVHRAVPGVVPLGKGAGGLPGSRTDMNSSNLSLDTTGSSQLSSSLSSDSLLQGQDPHADLDLSPNGDCSTKRPTKDVLSDVRSSGHSSQDSMREEDSFVSSVGPDHISDATAYSGSDSEIQGPVTPFVDLADRTKSSSPPCSEPAPELVLVSELQLNASESRLDTEVAISKPVEEERTSIYRKEKETEIFQRDNAVEVKNPTECTSEPSANSNRNVDSESAFSRPASVVGRQISAESLSYSHSWISEDDIYKPHLEEVPDLEESPACVNGLIPPSSEPDVPQPPPSVVHRRHKGLANPFRGLLKLGHLEYRSVLGRWRDYYCELSPFEFRLYLDAEERTVCENSTLLRCEDARVTSADGRFELAFSGKRLYLRAANRDEAEDWVDRIVEAVNKCRPTPRLDDQWEVLQFPPSNGLNEPSASSTPSSPERGSSSADVEGGGGCTPPPPLPPQDLDWTRSADSEPDAIKEAVLYFSPDTDGRPWVRLVFSLSLEALKGFWVQDGRKSLRIGHPIEVIRDVVPAVSLGGEAFFKLLTCKETLRLRAESPEEARTWRALIRGALDSYLDSADDGVSEEPAVGGQATAGNIHRLVQHRLKGDGVLLAHLYTVPTVKGLDKQSFKCAGCPRQIGLSLGRVQLCEFSGQYYCDSCHLGDTTIIPSRMVHNWDLTAREVSRKALRLLEEIEQEPLLNLEQLNPELMEHAEPMGQAHCLRQSLRLLGDYLLTCRSGACKKVQARLQKRTYLLESSQLYSVLDLRQIVAGQYVAYLNTLVQSATSHVHQCELCSQRGFYCQICNSDDVIFPFQVDSTTRCKDCKSVFHLACHAKSPSCSRCQRRKKYLDLQG